MNGKVVTISLTLALTSAHAAEEHHSPRLSDVAVPLIDKDEIKRPDPILELGNSYLSTGDIEKGFELPTGAVWQPSFMAYGTFRTAFQHFEEAGESSTEWVNRLDLYGNLQLSGTERVVIGFRPFDREGRFTGYLFDGDEEGWQEEFDGELQALFFEGELGQLFPGFDASMKQNLVWNFSVGRQPLLIQDGMLVDDDLDLVGLTLNNGLPKSGSNLRHTLVYGWNDIHRNNVEPDHEPRMIALFNAFDGTKRTLNLDVVYIDDPAGESSGISGAIDAIQRVGHMNLTLRALTSHALDEETELMEDGHLFFAELSKTVVGTEDFVYLNAFCGVDEFTSAARGPDRGGTLGRAGILFAAVGLGSYGAPLGNQPERCAGAAIGRQFFSDDMRRQLIVELGGRKSTECDDQEDGMAIGARYRHAMGRHSVWQVDLFGAVTRHDDPGFGVRLEYRYEF